MHGDAPVEGPLLNQVADDWFVELVEERTALAQSHRMGEEQQFVQQMGPLQLGGEGGAADADVAGWMKANLPTLPRLLWALLGKRQYAGYRRRVYGDAAAA